MYMNMAMNIKITSAASDIYSIYSIREMKSSLNVHRANEIQSVMHSYP